jgi:hypothetical protein
MKMVGNKKTAFNPVKIKGCFFYVPIYLLIWVVRHSSKETKVDTCADIHQNASAL